MNHPTLEIRTVPDPVNDPDFYLFRRNLWKNDPAAPRPLLWMEKLQFDREKNSFFEHATICAFVCYKNGTAVGRIAAIKDDLHNDHYSDRVGFFGFFDLVDDQEVANALLDTAENWLRDQGCDTIRGPVNPSMKSEFGVLVEGNDTLPKIMMGHSPRYYQRLVEGWGLEVCKKFYCYEFDTLNDADEDYEKKMRVTNKTAARIRKRYPNFRFEAVNKNNYEQTFRAINKLGNVVRADNYGFVPLTDAELQNMISQMGRIIRLDMIHVAYLGDRLVGFIVNIPDVNWALSKTWGQADWLRMPQLLYWIKRTPNTRVIAFGVDEEFRTKGLAAILIKQLRDRWQDFEKWEFSWVVEDNVKSMRAIESMVPFIRSRTYHLYESPIR